MKMHGTTLKMCLGVVVAAAVLAGAIFSPVYAAGENTQELKQEIKQLNQKIEALEKRLEAATTSASSAASQPPAAAYQSTWDPFMEMRNMQKEMNQMFNDSFWRGFGQGPAGAAVPGNLLNPDMDLKESGDHYVLSLEAPGMDQGDIQIEVKNQELTISGKKQSESSQQDQNNRFYRQEREYGYFSRSVMLPEDADAGKFTTEFKNGVLTVTIPKQASAKGKAANSSSI